MPAGGTRGVETTTAGAAELGAVGIVLPTLAAAHVSPLAVDGRDRLQPASSSRWVSPEHDNVRGPGYYH